MDNTFTPGIISPSRFGADVVIHSCTKYISGASDLIAGVVISSHEFIASLIDVNHGVAMLLGPVMDAKIAHELYLRLDHLPLRMRGHSKMAMDLATAAEKEGVRVIYPGLPSHPQHHLMKDLQNPDWGFGGVLSIDCKDPQRAMKLAAALQEAKFGLVAVSLGFSRTLMSCPSVSTSSEIPQEEQKAMNLSPGLLRLSIGYTGDSDVMVGRFLKCYRDVG